MPFSLHDIDLADGSTPTFQDRLIAGLQLAVANAAGTTSVTTAVAFASQLPPNYSVFVDAGQAVIAYVTGKTSTGFNVVLASPASGGAIAAGTFNVLVVA
jgi:hypothetical protein